MAEPSVNEVVPINSGFTPEQILDIYRRMILIRRFEESCYAPYRQGKFGGYLHVYVGQEAVAMGFMQALRSDDMFICTYRDHGHLLARGGDPNRIMAELFGRATGVAHGKGGSMHLVDHELGFYGGYGIVGGNVPLATGIGYSIKYKGGDQVCLCFFGEGAFNNGAVHEALNMASVYEVPVVFIVENNNYSMATPVERSSAVSNFSDRAQAAYGMKSERIPGMNFFEVYESAKRIIDEVRETQKPAFVEAMTYRFEGHGIADNATNQALYRTKEEVEEQKKLCPIAQMESQLIKFGIATQKQIDDMDAQAKDIVVDALKFANDSPEPAVADLYRSVYTDLEVKEWR